MMMELTFEEKVVNAVRQVEDGHPLKDFLQQMEVEEAIQRLSDVYITLGIVRIADLEDKVQKIKEEKDKAFWADLERRKAQEAE